VEVVVDDDSSDHDNTYCSCRREVKQMDGRDIGFGSALLFHPAGRFSQVVDFSTSDICPLVVSSGINFDSLHY
jgi:hypothetical protein